LFQINLPRFPSFVEHEIARFAAVHPISACHVGLRLIGTKLSAAAELNEPPHAARPWRSSPAPRRN
jgi:hypothetical protein